MFIEQTFKAKTDWWRYILGIIVIFIGWQVIGVIPLLLVAFYEAGNFNTFIAGAETGFVNLGIDPNFYLLLLIITFTCGLLGIWFAVKYIHEQPFKEVTTAREKVDWSRIRYAFFMVVLINLPLFIIGYLLEPEAFQWNFDPIPFFVLSVIAILFLPLQTSFEEYLFRGYLMQGLGLLARNKWVPLIFTSVMFGLLHGLNPEVEKVGYIMFVFYIGTGFLLGIMTLMDEGMELALGFHAANNIFAAILVTTDWTAFQVPALLIDISEPSAGFDIVAPVVIIYPIYLYILARKYGWTDWKGKLFGKVEKPVMLKHSE
jgi:membrane protease YdiL (CAAX protease family)